MTEGRLPLPSVESLSEDQRRVYDAILSGPRGTVPALFMAFLHNAELADRVQALGALLRYDTSLEPRLSELAILAVARHWSCQYEWHWHAPEAAKAGLPDTVIEAIKHRRSFPCSGDGRRSTRPPIADFQHFGIFSRSSTAYCGCRHIWC